jgi:hypothetical protein
MEHLHSAPVSSTPPSPTSQPHFQPHHEAKPPPESVPDADVVLGGAEAVAAAPAPEAVEGSALTLHDASSVPRMRASPSCHTRHTWPEGTVMMWCTPCSITWKVHREGVVPSHTRL